MAVLKTININGALLDLSVPKVMGVINVTPDSFYQGSRHRHLGEILRVAGQMIKDGSSFIDIGGYSSRPGARDISVEEELGRVIAPIEAIAREFPGTFISIDTFRSGVAYAAVQAGACLINDISAGTLDDQMMDTAGKLGMPYIAMHMRGTPRTMGHFTGYKDLIKEMARFFSGRAEAAKASGIKDMIIDPGFGFSKTLTQNYALLADIDYLSLAGFPILIGISRKSMIYRSLNIDPGDALNGTTVLNTVALLKGASILRVHDVKEAVQAVELINLLKS